MKATVEIRDPKPIEEPSLPALAPHGEFVSARYESDCARFLAETKSLARHRAEAGFARPSMAR